MVCGYIWYEYPVGLHFLCSLTGSRQDFTLFTTFHTCFDQTRQVLGDTVSLSK